jgi:hypothetical protein
MANHSTQRRRRSVRSDAEEHIGIGSVSAKLEKIQSLGKAGWISSINWMQLVYTAQDVSSLFFLAVIVLTFQSFIMMGHSTPAILIETGPVASALQCKHSQKTH